MSDKMIKRLDWMTIQADKLQAENAYLRKRLEELGPLLQSILNDHVGADIGQIATLPQQTPKYSIVIYYPPNPVTSLGVPQ